MELEDLERRDKIYSLISEHAEGLNAEEVCEKFFPNHLIGQPQRHVRKILSQDPRFCEYPIGNWRIAHWPFEQDQNLDRIRYCVFDLETTGGVPPLHRIIEIGACILEGGQIVKSFEALVNPERPIPDYVKKLTGIRDKDLANARDLRAVLMEFLEFSQNCVLVAHNASFDVNFINAECMRVLNTQVVAPNLCTLKMSKFLVRECGSHRLEAMAEFFDVELGPRHRALGDAHMTAQILAHLIKRAKEVLKTECLQDLRKFGIHVPIDFFPPSLASPELLNELSTDSGIVKFCSESGKCLQYIPMLNIKNDMASIFYENIPRSNSLKRLLKKARSFEICYEDSFLSAQIKACHQSVGRPRERERKAETENTIYLKILEKYPEEIYMCRKRLRDDASYLGPFESVQEACELLGVELEQRKVAYQRFPPNSGIEQGYQLKTGKISNLIKRNLRYVVNQVNLMISIPVTDSSDEMLVYFVREGYLLKKRVIDYRKMDQQSVENVLREVLKSYFLDRDLYEILGKTSHQKTLESEIVLRWWSRYSERDQRCRVIHLNRTDLQRFRESTVQKIWRGLFPHSEK